jgi:hypothetical protein
MALRRVAKYSSTSNDLSSRQGFSFCVLRSDISSWRYTITHSTPEVIPQLLCELQHLHLIIFYLVLTHITLDVVLPIPLPLSAILILVIGVKISPPCKPLAYHLPRSWIWVMRSCEWPKASTITISRLNPPLDEPSCPSRGTNLKLLMDWCAWTQENLVSPLLLDTAY